MDPQIVETLPNFVYFLVGLAVGLFGLWQSQKHFQAQQQDKFDQIHDELSDIRERLTTLAEAVSERAFARENRLFSLAIFSLAKGQATIDTATEEAAADIQTALAEELERAGVPDAVQHTAELEDKLSKIVAKSGERVADGRQDDLVVYALSSLRKFELALIKDIGDERFTTSQLATRVSLYGSESALHGLITRWREMGIVERSGKGTYRVSSRAQRLLAEMIV